MSMGWVLGKRDVVLITKSCSKPDAFLYAIERFDPEERHSCDLSTHKKHGRIFFRNLQIS